MAGVASSLSIVPAPAHENVAFDSFSATLASSPPGGAVSGSVVGASEAAAAAALAAAEEEAGASMGGSGARTTEGASSARSSSSSRPTETLALSSSETTYGITISGKWSMLSSVVVVKAIDGVTVQRVAPGGGSPHDHLGGRRMYAANVAETSSAGIADQKKPCAPPRKRTARSVRSSRPRTSSTRRVSGPSSAAALTPLMARSSSDMSLVRSSRRFISDSSSLYVAAMTRPAGGSSATTTSMPKPTAQRTWKARSTTTTTSCTAQPHVYGSHGKRSTTRFASTDMRVSTSPWPSWSRAAHESVSALR